MREMLAAICEDAVMLTAVSLLVRRKYADMFDVARMVIGTAAVITTGEVALIASTGIGQARLRRMATVIADVAEIAVN